MITLYHVGYMYLRGSFAQNDQWYRECVDRYRECVDRRIRETDNNHCSKITSYTETGSTH